MHILLTCATCFVGNSLDLLRLKEVFVGCSVQVRAASLTSSGLQCDLAKS